MGHSMIYEFETLEQFNLWHNALCLELGYPLKGLNNATLEIDESAQETTGYTSVEEYQGKWLAAIPNAEYAVGLVLASNLPKNETMNYDTN